MKVKKRGVSRLAEGDKARQAKRVETSGGSDIGYVGWPAETAIHRVSTLRRPISYTNGRHSHARRDRDGPKK